MDVLQILRLFDFYERSGRSLQQQIAAQATRKTLQAGEFFFREGDVCSVFAMLGSGSLRVFKIGESGREITLYRVTSGQTCLGNMVSSFLKIGSPAFAVAEEAIEAAIIPSRHFRAWMSNNPVMQRYVFETMASRLLDVMTLIEEVAFRRMDKRLAGFLLHKFEESPSSRDLISMTHEEIAAELGTAREVVSRLLKDFEKGGVIATGRERIEPIDKSLLSKLAADS